MTIQEFDFMTLTCSEQLTSDREIERLLKEVEQGETENTINSVNEVTMTAGMLISIINQVVPQRFEKGTYAYVTKGDGKEHKFGEKGTRIGIVSTNDCYKMTISREAIDDSSRVKLGLDQNVKRLIEKKIIDKYKFNRGVEF